MSVQTEGHGLLRQDARWADRLGPAEIGQAVWAARDVVLSLAAMGMLAGILFSVFVKPEYAAHTQVLIDPSDLKVVDNGLLATNQVADSIVIQVESQVRVLRSDNVLRRVITKEALEKDPEFSRGDGSIGDLIRAFLPLGSSRPALKDEPMLTALRELQRRVNIRRAERTYVVDIWVRTDDAEKSARIANAIVDSYLTEQTLARSEASRRATDSLAARLSEQKQRVQKAEQAVEEFRNRNNLVGAGGQLVSEQQLVELNNQLSLARARTAEAKARFDQVKVQQKSVGDFGSFTEAVQSPTVTALRSQYAEVLRRDSEQSASLGSSHPVRIELQAQAQRARGMIVEEINRIAEAAANDYARARASELSLAESLERLKREAVLTSEARVGLRELEREVQASRAVYEAFLVRSRETSEQERLDTKNIRVISPASIPLRRSWPPSFAIIYLLGGALGAAVGVAYAMLLSRRRAVES